MKVLILIAITISFNFSTAKACSTASYKTSIDCLTLKAKKLKQLYILSTSSSETSEVYQEQFFDEFPNTFEQLEQLYGYDSNKGGAILYDDGVKHIYELFNNLRNINDTLYYKKIVKIALGGHWDADAINYFQNGLRQRVESKPELTVNILEKMPEKHIKGFWYFYFDGPHPAKQIPDALKRIKTIDGRIYLLMINSQNEVLSQKK